MIEIKFYEGTKPSHEGILPTKKRQKKLQK